MMPHDHRTGRRRILRLVAKGVTFGAALGVAARSGWIGASERHVRHAAASVPGRLIGLTFPPVINADGRLVEVNPATGEFTKLRDVRPYAVTSGVVAIDPFTHRFYTHVASGTPQLRGFDTRTDNFFDALLASQLLLMAFETSTRRLIGLTFPPGMGVDGRLVEINPTTGAFTKIADVPSFSMTSGVFAIDPLAHRFYVQATDGSLRLRSFDTLTGSFTDTPLADQLLLMAFEQPIYQVALPLVQK